MSGFVRSAGQRGLRSSAARDRLDHSLLSRLASERTRPKELFRVAISSPVTAGPAAAPPLQTCEFRQEIAREVRQRAVARAHCHGRSRRYRPRHRRHGRAVRAVKPARPDRSRLRVDRCCRRRCRAPQVSPRHDETLRRAAGLRYWIAMSFLPVLVILRPKSRRVAAINSGLRKFLSSHIRSPSGCPSARPVEGAQRVIGG